MGATAGVEDRASVFSEISKVEAEPKFSVKFSVKFLKLEAD